MKRTIAVALAIAALVGVSAQANARTYYGFNIGISNAPPPPRVIFRSAPRVVMVPETRVYVIDDSYPDPGYDMFRSGEYWYVVDNGYWYRGRTYRGPYQVVDVRYVPRSVLRVPEKRWRHHPHGGPPGQTKKYARSDDYRYGRDYVGKSKGKGKSKGHDH